MSEPLKPFPTAQALIGTGQVRHTRLRPARNAFAYRTWFLLIPMRSWRRHPINGLTRNRRGLVSFHDADHGDGGPDALAWVENLLNDAGVQASGEIWLHTYPRVLGYVFNPVSFWYAHDAEGSLKAIVAEVNNTFGQRHSYVLTGPDMRWGRELVATKTFHVSPFCQVTGAYRFRFMRSGKTTENNERTVARIDYDDDQGPLLQTSVSGVLTPLTSGSLFKTVLSMPLLTLGIIARIHWQALKLLAKRVPFSTKPLKSVSHD
ncbi:DUF1365 domain-containing protein [Neopusillimonas aromaticivorans]|uniref:DUF1365 domain-containing protein n=1 Tax=Neopusillimonas aromaticivorans TaxID=2979868 RepID=UPI0025981C42|nr:DUF1365 domain-containing protein [Neopusillimonas aromaticivorans]WJJ94550.1 DUF1365 domain-containing protein [Neopusillimonas aromaticivorans]